MDTLYPKNVLVPTHPLSSCLSYSNLTSSYHSFICSISLLKEPTTYAQAIHRPLWKQAMQQELQALEANNIWYVTTLPPISNL